MDEAERKRQRIRDLDALIQNEQDALVSDAKERQRHDISEAVQNAREREHRAQIAKYQAQIDGLRAEWTAINPPQTPAAPSISPTHAFISYSRKDTPFVERLEAALNARGIVTWRDATSIPGGEDWYQNIVAGLAGAYAVICIVTQNADESKWVRREQLRADEDGIPPLAVHPAKYRNPLHLQEVQPILMDVPNYNAGLLALIAALTRCQQRERTVMPAAPVMPNDDAAIQDYLKWVLSDAKADLRDALYVDLVAAPERTPQMHSKSALAFGLDDEFVFSSIALEHLAHDDFAKAGADVPDARKAIRDLRRAVLLGDPGAGKTTTLLKIAVDLARGAQSDPTVKLPVYIPLREFDGSTPFAEFVRAKTHNLQAAFERLSDRFVLLCDALNEMPRHAADGRDLVAEVRETLDSKPDWVVSCRVRDYTDDLSAIDGIGKIRLKPLDLPRIEEFIRRKYAGWGQPERGAALWGELGGNTDLLKAWEAFVTHGKPEGFWDKEWLPQKPYSWQAEGRAWRTMHTDHRRLMALCRSPFMVNMVCALYRRSEKLPDNRAGLFRDFVANLLNAEKKRLTDIGLTWIGDALIRAGMGQIAWAMGAQTEMPRADAEAILRQTVSDPAKLLSAAASAQIIDYGVNVRFTHQLLQQYFAAAVLGEYVYGVGTTPALSESGRTMQASSLQASDLWKPDHWWAATGREETAILLAGDRNDPHGVARWLAPAQPHLALELLEQPDFALDLDNLDTETQSALIAGAHGKANEPDPVGRAAAYRVVGRFNADRRAGIGLRDDGLPDMVWCAVDDQREWTYQDKKHPPLPPYQIAKYPITYIQFQAFIDAADGWQNPAWWDGLAFPDGHNVTPGDQAFKYDNHPRERVSWYDAVAFCRWLSAKLGYEIRLPTEQEWERAARGTDGREYPYTGKVDPAKGNTSETGINQTSAVGIFPEGESPVGALDMGGNVWEWCLSDYYNPAAEAGQELLNTNNARVLRGGSWNFGQGDARAAYRNLSHPEFRGNSVGFRWVYGVASHLKGGRRHSSAPTKHGAS